MLRYKLRGNLLTINTGSNLSKINVCPVCKSADLDIIISLESTPIHCNILWPSREDALNAPKGDIELNLCNTCGYIFNAVFDSNRMNYSQKYDNSLYFSGRFQEYSNSVAKRLIEKYDLHNKKIIEIGSGKGDFLILLSELGNNRGIGFDPSYEEDRIDNKQKDQVTFIKDFYSEKYTDYVADIVCCRHVLEHVQNPVSFLSSIRKSINNRLNTVLFFEVPNILYTIRDLGMWDLIYEHFSYFSCDSLENLFSLSGFKVLSVIETFEGQYINIEAMPDKDSHIENAVKNISDKISEYIFTFKKKYYTKLKHWQSELKKIIQEDQKTVLWGAGSKGVTFLNTLKVYNQMEYIVDISPYKRGKFVAGTGQKIISPDFLQEYKPDLILVMNPIYLAEVKGILKKLNVKGKTMLV